MSTASVDDTVTFWESDHMERQAQKEFGAETVLVQQSCGALSHPDNPVTVEVIDHWPLRRQLWNNFIAMLRPVL